jgi:hypothetical protein
MSRHKFSANKIYNLEETGNYTVHVPPKIICAEGIKQVRSVTSGVRRIHVTMMAVFWVVAPCSHGPDDGGSKDL